MSSDKFSAISRWEQVIFWWDDDDDVCFVLNQYVQLVFYSTSSLKQQSVGRHVTLSLILNQQVSSLTP
jgi:hypothetical protein